MTRRQSQRVELTDETPYRGHQIDRGIPVDFLIDGHAVRGFSGDTILSAMLGEGFRALRTPSGESLVLDEFTAPRVRDLSAGRSGTDLPVHLALAKDKAEYRTTGLRPVPAASRLLKKISAGDALALRGWRMDRPARPLPPEQRELEFDLVVVGGGIAGMAAALHGARYGLSTALLEARPFLGGLCGLFGQIGDEPRDELIASQMSSEIAQTPLILRMTATRALAVAQNTVVASQLDQSGPHPVTRTISFRAGSIILATGLSENLPVIPGNRLPGTQLVGRAHVMAMAYGILPAGQSIFLASTNAAYRAATMVHNCGRQIVRIVDARIDPQSRFIDFTKAYGISLSSAESAAALHPAPHGKLALQITDSWNRPQNPAAAMEVENCYFGNGWRPELTLWVQAGGRTEWSETGEVAAVGDVEGMALAGSAAGIRSATACVAHAKNQVGKILGRKPGKVRDPIISERYETPDASPPVARPTDSKSAAAWLDASHGARLWLSHVADGPRIQSASNGSLTIGELAHLSAMGEVGPDQLHLVAAERCIVSETLAGQVRPPRRQSSPPPLPPFLEDRFGKDPVSCRLRTGDQRQLEAGSLIFRTTDDTAPENAVGVVFADSMGNDCCLIAASHFRSGTAYSVATLAGRVACRAEPV